MGTQAKKVKVFIRGLAMKGVEIGYKGDVLNPKQLEAAKKLSEADQKKYIGTK